MEMEFYSEITDRQGKPLVIRSLTTEEAPAVLFMMHRGMGETPFMALYPDEMRLTVEQEKAYIQRAHDNPNGVLLGAFSGGELVGICSVLPVSPKARHRHRASLGIMVLRAHWGRGIGTEMMRAAIDAMRATKIEQIELDVASTNEKAFALYQKFGFEAYGFLSRGMKYRDGSYADLHLMKLDLESGE